MIKKIIILYSVVLTPVFAETEVWKLGGHNLVFTRDEKNSLLISKSCESKDCIANSFLKKVSYKSLSSEKLSGGKNPGAVLCHESKIGEVVFLQDAKGNDNSFCLFKDDSMVSSSSISNAASMNDNK